MNSKIENFNTTQLSFEEFKKVILNDYSIAMQSREASLLGRKEVLTGKAKFGIFGDGKELPQIAMAKAFLNGDWRSGYYRDQTFMLAAGMVNLEELFAQLYANPDVKEEPHSGGRQMNAHFATRILDENGDFKNLVNQKNSSADSSPTAGQMTRALGLAFASKLYRAQQNEEFNNFTNNGNEVCFATIGDASTSEGHFWETINAAAVLKVPLAINVWDDGYGISVPKQYQTTKGSISEALGGMLLDENGNGIYIYKVKAWDYGALCAAYQEGIELCRKNHIPVLFHIEEVTQPQGHSTSGSHERYKSKERLEWEKDYDGIAKFKQWILANAIAVESELVEIENHAKELVQDAKKSAWQKYQTPIKNELNSVIAAYQNLINQQIYSAELQSEINQLQAIREPFRKDFISSLRRMVHLVSSTNSNEASEIIHLKDHFINENKNRYQSYLTSASHNSIANQNSVAASYSEQSSTLNGFEILNHFFDKAFAHNPYLLAFGEDLGHIGDVNQGFAGLQEKHGIDRIFDTGIREATIMGQAIGLALRGFRPIAEIQYLDYLLYGLQPLSDDLATLLYRTAGGQKAPIIVRTRGHRLEGIWHTGSPMQLILGSLRGINVCVPRNMTQAVGMYNSLLASDEPGLVIECLNGYRLKEKLMDNILEFKVEFGMPEIIKEGSDITIVSYGSTLRVIEEAIVLLEKYNISVELIDVQTLLPFDKNHAIVASLKKTNRILFVDEDVPSGATAYMMQQVMEIQQGYFYLDTPAQCLSASANRSPYGTDGDYFCKPSADDVFDKVMQIMSM